MDLILSVRQMMAEENFSVAEQALETALITAHPEQRKQLVPLYLEALLQQKKSLPDHLVAEVLIELWNTQPELALTVYENSTLKTSHDSRVLYFRMRIAERRGHIRELHQLISDFHIRLFEKNLPTIPPLVNELIQKYFRNDFQLRLQGLALTMLRKDYRLAEEQMRHLILEAYERSTPKLLRQKLESLFQVVSAQGEKGPLELYLGLLHVLVNGFCEKRDFKRFAEAVIYFDDFRFNVIMMNALLSQGYEDLALDYAHELAAHSEYDFVFIAKHFPELKRFFVNLPRATARSESWESPDLTLEEAPVENSFRTEAFEPSEDEGLLIHLIRNQEYSDAALLDLAVSFVQSELPRVAVAAAMTVHARATEPGVKLKAAYLALTSLLLSGDYRRALDLALESMKYVTTTDDLLSFFYCEAEAYIRLDMRREAREVLQKIVSIDSRYRLARERLEKLG